LEWGLVDAQHAQKNIVFMCGGKRELNRDGLFEITLKQEFGEKVYCVKK